MDRQKSLNKIGHALHELDPEFKRVTYKKKIHVSTGKASGAQGLGFNFYLCWAVDFKKCVVDFMNSYNHVRSSEFQVG